MSVELEPQPPPGYAQLQQALASRGSQASLAPSLGALIRILAASRPGGVFVCLGHAAGEAAIWMRDGMDLSARLVVVVGGDAEADMLRGVLGDDLQLTVHVQHAGDFLRDVRDHRFDFITDLNPGPDHTLARLALARLAPGAFYMCLHSVSDLAAVLGNPGTLDGDRDGTPNSQDFSVAHLDGKLGISLLVHGPRRPQARRRGGRRTRRGVTQLFSSKPERRR